MTTTTVSGEICGERVRYDFLGTLQAGWRAMLRHRQERRALVALSRLPPHVIHDMGFDPEQIYAALDGSWDEVDPGNFRSYLPRKEHI